MDDLKSKFKSLLSKTANTANQITSKKFSGQGHRLGTAEERGEQPKQPSQGSLRPPAASSSTSRRVPEGAKLSAPATPATTGHGQHHQSPAINAQQRAQALHPATEFSPFTAVIGSGAALGANRNTADAAATTAPHIPHAQTQSAATNAASISSAGIPVSVLASEQRQHEPASPQQVEELQHSLALIASQPESADTTLQILLKLLNNLSAAPKEAKYRQIRLSNPKIQQYVVQVPGALQFLAAAGFQIHNAGPSDAAAQENTAGEDDGFAVFLDDSMLGLVQEALTQIQRVLPAVQTAEQQSNSQLGLMSTATASTSSLPAPATANSARNPVAQQVNSSASVSAAAIPPTAAAVPPVTRDTQVLLPAAPDVEVPDWFFERTGAELKAEYMSMLRQRQTNEVISSRSWKEAQLGKKAGAKPTVATVRVRFPEGVCLQGRFHVSEAVSAVFEWTSDALRDPAVTYELIQPNRKPLIASGLVCNADLAPAVLLNFRLLSQQGEGRSSASQQQSYLKDELLLQARAD